jgi:hypothetical protein
VNCKSRMFNQRFDDTLEFDWDMELAPQIVETVGTGVAPDHLEDLDTLAALEARIDDLVHLRESLLQTKGMSQHFALEAQRILPDFDGARPLGFYTTTPSATRYRVALEELSNGIWALIAAGIAAVIYAIVKFFKWLRRDHEDQEPEQIVQRRLSQLKEVQSLLRQCDKLVSDGVESTHGQYLYLKDKPQQEVYSLDKVINELFMDSTHDRRIAAFLQTKDPFFHDLVHKGPYSQELASLGGFFKDLQVVMRQRLSALEALSHADLHNEETITTLMTNKRTLDILNEPVRVKVNGEEHTLAEVRSRMAHLNLEATSTDVEGTLSFDQLFSVMSEAFANTDLTTSLEGLQTTTPLLDKLKDELTRLDKQAGEYAKDGRKSEHTQFVGQQLRHAVFILGQDIANLTALSGELLGYQSRLLYLASNAASFATAVAIRLSANARNQNGGELTRWRSVGLELKKVDEQFKQTVGL